MVYSARVREPSRTITVRIPGVTRQVYQDFEDWIVQETDYGIEEFTFVDHDRAIHSVRLLSAELKHVETKPMEATLVIELAIQ